MCLDDTRFSPQIARTPDWGWMRAQFPKDRAIRFDQKISNVVRKGRGRIAYLATPYLEHEVGPAQAAKCAAKWSSVLGHEGVTCHSPVIEAWKAETSRGAFGAMEGQLPDWRAMLTSSDLVVVPPVRGWDGCQDVWAAVNRALVLNIPVFVLRDHLI